MALSMAFVVLTRLVQAALLVGLFALGYGPSTRISKGLGLWWSALVLSVLVVVSVVVVDVVVVVVESVVELSVDVESVDVEV